MKRVVIFGCIAVAACAGVVVALAAGDRAGRPAARVMGPAPPRILLVTPGDGLRAQVTTLFHVSGPSAVSTAVAGRKQIVTIRAGDVNARAMACPGGISGVAAVATRKGGALLVDGTPITRHMDLSGCPNVARALAKVAQIPASIVSRVVHTK